MTTRSLFQRVLAVVALALSAAALPGPLAPHAHAAQQLYTCGMHPQVIKAEPGDCPICGMKLTPVRANASSSAASAANIDPLSAITIDPVTIQKMNLKTDVVRTGPVRRTIRAVGNVAFNEESLVDITTKYEGWIEKLFVNSTWSAVKAGDPLFEIYSPDLYSAQLNYVIALRTEGADNGPLANSARSRLALFDIPESFVEELTRGAEPRRTFVYRAPRDGIVIEKPAVQGMMVKPGEKIFRLADLSTVWVTAQLYENDSAFVQPGQEATVRTTFGAEREFKGKVDLLLPELSTETRTVQARLVIENPDGHLKPGMFVDVRFETELDPSAVLVPDVAVLRSGEHNTVFIAHEGGTFEPRAIELGPRTQDNFYAVRSGLSAGERVVTSGQFLLDSESQLREAIQKMIRAASGETVPASTPSAPASTATRKPPVDPAAASTPLAQLAFAAADAAAPLAADDLAGYRERLPVFRDTLAAYFASDEHAVHGPLAQFQNTLDADPADLKAARRDFEPLSTAIADLAREAHLHHTASLHVFECPMSPVLGKGRWLQRAPGTKNPFFGSRMLKCGDELE